MAVITPPAILVPLHEYTKQEKIVITDEVRLKVLDYGIYQQDDGDYIRSMANVIVQDSFGVNHSFQYAVNSGSCDTDYSLYRLQKVTALAHDLFTESLFIKKRKRFDLNTNLSELMCGNMIRKQEPVRIDRHYKKTVGNRLIK